MSADPGEQYLSDGLTEDIITELSRFRQLQVVSRNHSFRYRGSDIDVVRAGRELGAQFLVEGSVRKAGDNIRIAAQLIDAATGHHVWAERFDCEKKEVFAVQDQVVRTIAATVLGQVKAAATEMALRKPPANLEAYECVLKADDLPFDDPESAAEAQKLFERAIKLDPTYARAYALFANLYVVRWSRDGSGSDDLLNTAIRLARKSVELDGRDSACHQALGWIYMLRRSFDLAEHHKQRAVELAPNQPTPFTSLGWFYHIIGKRKQAFDIYTEARKIDPYFEPLWYWPSIGCFYFNDHEYEQALAHLGRTTLMVYWVEAYRAAAYAYLGNLEQARACSAEVQRQVPDFSSARFAAKEGFKNEEDEGHLRDGLLKAGLPS
jgi:TolB-like protein/Tfp pilus assembly protein PilF